MGMAMPLSTGPKLGGRLGRRDILKVGSGGYPSLRHRIGARGLAVESDPQDRTRRGRIRRAVEVYDDGGSAPAGEDRPTARIRLNVLGSASATPVCPFAFRIAGFESLFVKAVHN